MAKKPLKPTHIVFGLLLGMFIGLAFLPRNERSTPLAEALPPLQVTTLSGERYNAEDARGKILLVHFWASWCAPCVHEFPDLLETVAAHPDDIVLLTVSADMKPEDATAFMEKVDAPVNAPNMHHVWDSDLSISQTTFQVMSFPETIIVDREGMMAEKIVGASKSWQESLKPHIFNP